MVKHFIKSKILTANDLGALASVEKMPEAEELIAFAKEENIKAILDAEDYNEKLQHHAHQLLIEDNKLEAFMTMMLATVQ